MRKITNTFAATRLSELAARQGDWARVPHPLYFYGQG